jgi:UDP-N-acetylmuramate dehydrogenase
MSWRTQTELAWLAALPGVRRDHPLAPHTSLSVGGPAEFFVETANPAGVAEECHRRGVPYLLLGSGTNLLVADSGVDGLVIRCVSRGWEVDGPQVRAEAGLKMMRLARICADHDLTGFEWAIGVPGTVGGAVYQNAGCWGSEVAEVLVQAEGVTPGRGPQVWPRECLGLAYRTSALREGLLRGAVVLAATFQLQPGDGGAARRQMARWSHQRNRTQPIKTRNCGSVFKNPPGDSAGRLVEAAGLRGTREGAAEVSEQHGNFIVNLGGATAAEVDRLIRRIQATVSERFGVALETEVERVGRWEPAP